ncbi:GumC family protein [Terriglobus sp.]|uniref:GumC family protein n=1 Tax=Terriglobus sp. TaxID=1889013 RepID=UPI003AFFF3E5
MIRKLERDTDRDGVVTADEEVSLLDFVVVLAARRNLILKTTLGTALIGCLLAFVLPTRYTASTAILPPQQGSSAGAALMGQLGSLGSVASLAGGGVLGSLKNPNDLQVAMLKSRTVEDAMIDRFHLMDRYKAKYMSEAIKEFEKRVDIDSGAKDGLIRISVSDSDPHIAQEMANGYVEEFKRLTGNLAVTEASQRRLFFEQQLVGAKDNLATAEEELKKTEQQSGLVQLDSQARAVITSVAQLRAQIAAKEVQIGAMRSYATNENPELQVAEQELAGLRAQEQKMGASSDQGLNMLPIPKGNLQQAGLDYVRKLRDVKYYETIFDLLARQYEVAKVDEARQGAVIQVVDRAVVPDRRSSPKRTLIVLGAAVFGFLLGIVWALAAKGLTRLQNNPAERPRLDALRATFARTQPGTRSRTDTAHS